MKHSIFYIIFLLFCSCAKERTNFNDLNTIIQATFNSSLVLEDINDLGLIDNDTIFFLQNDTLGFNNYINGQGNSIVSFSENYFEEKKSKKFLYLHNYTINKNLALLQLAFYTNTGIKIYLEKEGENWLVSDIIVNEYIRLRNSKAVSLSFKIDSIKIFQNDLNIKKVQKNINLKEAINIMDNAEVVKRDSLGYKIYNYSA
ncbi:MAG: hypothetical protein KDC94_12415, partial [Aequorivita sp.]|nr:hypothetical protein [Aequorivita sp.]